MGCGELKVNALDDCAGKGKGVDRCNSSVIGTVWRVVDLDNSSGAVQNNLTTLVVYKRMWPTLARLQMEWANR